jgi:hypothetical protein
VLFRLDLFTSLYAGWIDVGASVLFQHLLRPTFFTHQFPYFDLSALHFRLSRNDTEVRIPRPAYRQRLFLCGPASFFELHCIPRISGALSSNSRRARYLRRQRRSAFSPGRECITNILCLHSSCSACCLASPQLDLVSPAFGADALVFDFLFYIPQKAIPFPLPYPSASWFLHVVFRVQRESLQM